MKELMIIKSRSKERNCRHPVKAEFVSEREAVAEKERHSTFF
jgi:hypothetical protein